MTFLTVYICAMLVGAGMTAVQAWIQICILDEDIKRSTLLLYLLVILVPYPGTLFLLFSIIYDLCHSDVMNKVVIKRRSDR